MEITGDVIIVIKRFGIPIYSKTVTTKTDFDPEEYRKNLKQEIAEELTTEIKKGLNIR